MLRAAFGDRLVAVALFGPVARGDAHAGSEIDVLVVVDPISPGPFSRKDLLAAADDALAPLLADAEADGIHTRLRRVVGTRGETEAMLPLLLDVAEEGVVLRDRDGYLATLLDRIRASLAHVGAHRVREGGAWYWEMGARAAG